MNTQEYFKHLEKEVKEVYAVAEQAKQTGIDFVEHVEIPLAMSMAEKVVGLVSTIYPQLQDQRIVKRILELEKEHGKLDPAVSIQIAEEVSKQKFCKFKSLLEAIEAGARVGIAYTTLGVVSSPIEGLTEIKILKTKEGKEYLSPYFSGPMRSAGGTGEAFSLVIIDHLREIFGYSKYDPTEEEIKRTVTELTDYHERITNLQYMPTEEEMIFLAKNIPLQVSGEPSEKIEVSNYKNIERISTNSIRSGFCLVIGEGLAQKAAKIKRYIDSLRKKGFKFTDWDFLDEYIKIHQKRDLGKSDDSPTYIKDLVAGRPVFAHPSRSGGFRFRYGRSRVSGFSAFSLHPATMAVTDGFIATGTQLKIEKPTKGGVVTSCDSIEGPIVKLVNGSVKKLKTQDEAKKLYPDIEEIIYLGDILFPFSDLSNRNAYLIKPGYVEEWWGLELKEKNKEIVFNDVEISIEEAIKLSIEYQIPLNPKFIYYWTEISKDEFFTLVEWLWQSKLEGKIVLPYTKKDQERFKKGKRALELLGVEHNVIIENVVIDEKNSKALFVNFGISLNIFENKSFLLKDLFIEINEKVAMSISEGKTNVLGIINFLSKIEIKDKAGSFIGARMGRPEKTKLKKLTGSPNVLFPVGSEGGRLRSVQSACEQGTIVSAFPIYYCEICKKETIYSVCETCEKKCKKMFYCPDCQNKSFNVCMEHNKSQSFFNWSLDINHFFNSAVRKLGLNKHEIPALIKGVRGTSSGNHIMERLEKGFLRAIFNLQVNKDGTIRIDSTELPLTHFKPKEVYVEIQKLKELGYDKDICGNELTSDDQILELMPHDILLPCSPESKDERADEVFLRICNFVDAELERIYGLKPFYNIKKREDLIGQIGVCMAPHNCAGVICRIIGFSNTLGLFASPYMHAAIRRDCDGDEASIMLLGDVLLNFSRNFLPSHRGGTQDAPLVLNAKIDAGEVDDQILDFEIVNEYPLELYRLAEQEKHSSEIKIKNVREILNKGENPFVNIGFTHDSSDFNKSVVCSTYKSLATMQEKVEHQMNLVEKIRAADTSDTARLILERHFIKDLKGNLRKFSAQEFRCVACNEIMRRPPLSGVCSRCNGKIIFTVNEGGIKKYLDPALNLANKYNLSPYLKQNLDLIKRYIDSIFGKEIEKQEALGKWF